LRFEVHIIGCGAALPLPGRNPTAQVVNVHEKQFLFDCGEGTQIALRNGRIRMMRIDHIAISHLHGDHYFGLFGLLSTFNLLGRTRSLNLYGPPALKQLLADQEAAGETVRGYRIHFHPTSTAEPEVLFEDASLVLESFPVRHRIPTTGFLIREKEKEPGVKREAVARLNLIPTEILQLKKGQDVVRKDGSRILFSEACHRPPVARSYAFAADTRYWAQVAEFVKGVDLLYHEATFLQAMKDRAEKTYHSTAVQAARLAKEAGVGRLLIGHISARYSSAEDHLEEARSIFPETDAAKDGLVTEVKYRC
jgi:ribonuclease Z